MKDPVMSWDDMVKASAESHGVDFERALVWDVFSNLFLDTYFDEDVLERYATSVAESPFSYRELGHILFQEVHPVCFGDLLSVAGEWAGFHPDWLVPRCCDQMCRHSYRASGDAAELSKMAKLTALTFKDGMQFLERVQRIRDAVRS